MNDEQFDAERTRLRKIVAIVDRDISGLSNHGNEAQRAAGLRLTSSWARLVQALALGPAPELRECPFCNHVGMCDATMCGYCWAKLPPLEVRAKTAA
jgi:hypothetical protein